jgi:hypothetical protein
MEHAMHELTPEEEIALRRIANQSLSVEPKFAARLAQIKLVERLKDGWRLTALGRLQYERLARPPLLLQKHPAYIDRLLDRAIPMARAAGIPQPDSVPESPEETESRPCTQALSENGEKALQNSTENGHARDISHGAKQVVAVADADRANGEVGRP